MYARLSSDTSTSGGSSDTDTNALAVMPCVWPSYWAVITVTPLANRPSALRNWRESKGQRFRLDLLAAYDFAFAVLHHHADVVRIDQIRHRPAVQIVFGHALLGEAFVFGRLAHHVGHHQSFKADALVIAEVIALVELVPAAELGAHRVPHQLHQLDAVHAPCSHSIRARTDPDTCGSPAP